VYEEEEEEEEEEKEGEITERDPGTKQQNKFTTT
jgi:hypothetical protein